MMSGTFSLMAPLRNPAARRFLLFLLLVSWGLPVSLQTLRTYMATPPSGPLFTFFGTRGPWAGSRNADGTWSHPDEPVTDTFRPGQHIVWESRTDITPGVTVNGDVTLQCNGRTVAAEELHSYSAQGRTGAWVKRGISVPLNAPIGDCAINREFTFTDVGGRMDKQIFPVLRVKIVR